MDVSIIPTDIKLLQKQRVLILTYANGERCELSCHQLRENTPSADKSQTFPDDVNIIAIEPVGQYAIKLIFDDGHQTGIYRWEFLKSLGS